MNFDLRKPCKGCPFVDDEHAVRHLGEERAEGIVDSITRMQQSFTCHKTTEYCEEKGEHVTNGKEQHCAGALILLEKHNQPNQMMRISERFGGYDRTKLEMDSGVYDTYEDFIESQR